MELVGKVIQVLPPQEGVGRNGNPWKLQGYVLETLDQYPRKVHFEVFGEDRIKQNPCEIDQLVTIDIESREFNGRWYTSIRAWRIQQGDMTQAAAPAPAAAPVAAAPAAAPAPAAQPAAQPAAPQAEVANVDPFDASAGDGTSDLPF